nr:hypothetical protein [uncultured Sellimonas sp.]
MIQETIRAVKDAEAKAQAILEQADAEAAEILAEAERQADDLKKSAVKEAKEKAQKGLDDLIQQSKAGESAFDEETVKEVEALKAVAKQKEAQAVDMILSNLF